MFHRKVIFHSWYIQVFVFLTIHWFIKYVMSWWELVHETGYIFEYIFWTRSQVMFPVFYFFERVNNGDLSGKYQLLKIDRSCYIVISLKSSKGLELVSGLQHWTTDMLEKFVIRYTSIWPIFILIVLRIQKK